jgi:hypothetical protein
VIPWKIENILFLATYSLTPAILHLSTASYQSCLLPDTCFIVYLKSRAGGGRVRTYITLPESLSHKNEHYNQHSGALEILRQEDHKFEANLRSW